jgi:hypothetical protein
MVPSERSCGRRERVSTILGAHREKKRACSPPWRWGQGQRPARRTPCPAVRWRLRPARQDAEEGAAILGEDLPEGRASEPGAWGAGRRAAGVAAPKGLLFFLTVCRTSHKTLPRNGCCGSTVGCASANRTQIVRLFTGGAGEAMVKPQRESRKFLLPEGGCYAHRTSECGPESSAFRSYG